MERTPRVAAIHDLSAFGRCSLTVVMPVLSAMGVQCCPIPTAYLSTHTGGFDGMVRRDLSEEMGGTIDHWEDLGIAFDGICTGYLASEEQAELCIRAIDGLKAEGGIAVVDPVMGDHGRLYRGCSQGLCRAMAELSCRGDVITPNATECALLLGREYREISCGEEGMELACLLSGGGRRSVVLTGVPQGENRVGAACFDRKTGESALVSAQRVEGQLHGTGDIFTAVLTGGLMRGDDLGRAAQRAAEFVSLCAARTVAQGYPRREGVDFEPLLGMLAAEKGL